jgi:hypothetical protein
MGDHTEVDRIFGIGIGIGILITMTIIEGFTFQGIIIASVSRNVGRDVACSTLLGGHRRPRATFPAPIIAVNTVGRYIYVSIRLVRLLVGTIVIKVCLNMPEYV